MPVEEEIVEPDWARWAAVAFVWVPLLIIVAAVNSYALAQFPHAGPQASGAELDDVLRKGIRLLKLQTIVNAVPFVILGIQAALHGVRIIRTRLYPPPGSNVLFHTRRKSGPSVTFVGLCHLIMAASFFVSSGARLWFVLRL